MTSTENLDQNTKQLTPHPYNLIYALIEKQGHAIHEAIVAGFGENEIHIIL